MTLLLGTCTYVLVGIVAIRSSEQILTYIVRPLSRDPQGSTQHPVVVEYSFNLASPGPRKVYDSMNKLPDPGSNLAACWDPDSKARLIFFQGYGKDATLYAFWSDGSNCKMFPSLCSCHSSSPSTLTSG